MMVSINIVINLLFVYRLFQKFFNKFSQKLLTFTFVEFIIMCEEGNSDNEREKIPWLWSLYQ